MKKKNFSELIYLKYFLWYCSFWECLLPGLWFTFTKFVYSRFVEKYQPDVYIVFTCLKLMMADLKEKLKSKKIITRKSNPNLHAEAIFFNLFHRFTSQVKCLCIFRSKPQGSSHTKNNNFQDFQLFGVYNAQSLVMCVSIIQKNGYEFKKSKMLQAANESKHGEESMLSNTRIYWSFKTNLMFYLRKITFISILCNCLWMLTKFLPFKNPLN